LEQQVSKRGNPAEHEKDASGGFPPVDRQNVEETREAGGGNPPPGAAPTAGARRRSPPSLASTRRGSAIALNRSATLQRCKLYQSLQGSDWAGLARRVGIRNAGNLAQLVQNRILPDAISILATARFTRDFASDQRSEQNLPERCGDRSSERGCGVAALGGVFARIDMADVDLSALDGEMAGAFVLAIGLCSGHRRQAFGGDIMPTPTRGFEPRRDAWQA
jgi:hypothetical protein